MRPRPSLCREAFMKTIIFMKENYGIFQNFRIFLILTYEFRYFAYEKISHTFNLPCFFLQLLKRLPEN